MADKFILTTFFLNCKSKLIVNLTFVFSLFRLAFRELRQFFSYAISLLPFRAFFHKSSDAGAAVKKSGERLQSFLYNLSLNHAPKLHTFIANKFSNSAKYKRAWCLCICGIGCSTAILGLLVGFVSYIEGYEIRRKVNTSLLVADSADLLKYKWNNDEKSAKISYRSRIDFDNVLGISETENDMEQTVSMLVFTGQDIRFLDSIEKDSIDLFVSDSNLIPVVPFDSAQEAVLLAGTLPSQYGEPLDENGHPIRWASSYYNASSNFKLTCITPQKDSHARSAIEKIVLTQAKLLPKVKSESLYVRASRYKSYIEKSAKRYGLSTDLVYAIIYNESNFGAGRVSPRSAMGLMQLMPETAGSDVHSFLYGYTAKLGKEQLFDPETNINYGTAYLYLLLNRDLVGIKNKITREYCAIASYNMGPNGFLRLFSKDRSEAIKKINSMTAQEIFVKLTTKFPIMETRNYVARVVKSRNVFIGF